MLVAWTSASSRTSSAVDGPGCNQPTSLPAGLRRRTPGLRREEVAISPSTTTHAWSRPADRIRHGRSWAGPTGAPAFQARTCTTWLASPGPPAGPPSDIRPGIRHLVNRLEDAAVTVLDATYQLVAWNALATALLGDFSAMAPRDRNLFRRRFLMLDPNAPLHRTS